MKPLKLFNKKINNLDLILGGVLLVGILVVYLFFYRKTQFVNIRVKVTDEDVLYANTNPKSWYANRFTIGDSEKDGLGRAVSTITNVQTFSTTAETKAVYLDIQIKAVYDRGAKTYMARGTNLVFGNTLKFNFPQAAFMGLITESPDNLNQNGYSESVTQVSVLARGVNPIYSTQPVEPEILGKIKKGETITDSNGKVLATVTNITLRPAQRITQTAGGDLLLKSDPYYKDAIITLDIRVKLYKNDRFVFDTIPLKYGVFVPLNFSYGTIWPVIIDIK